VAKHLGTNQTTQRRSVVIQNITTKLSLMLWRVVLDLQMGNSPIPLAILPIFGLQLQAPLDMHGADTYLTFPKT